MMPALSVQCVDQIASMTFRRSSVLELYKTDASKAKKSEAACLTYLLIALNGTLCVQQEYLQNVRYAIRKKLKKVTVCKYMNTLINTGFNC